MIAEDIFNKNTNNDDYDNECYDNKCDNKYDNKYDNKCDNPDIVIKKENNKCISYDNYKQLNQNILLTKSGGFIKFELFDDYTDNEEINSNLHKYIKKIMNKFTLSYKNIMGNMEYIKRYSIDLNKKRLIIPRFAIYNILSDYKKYGLKNNCGIHNMITEGNEPELKFTWNGNLTSNQKIIIDYMNKYIYNENRYNNGSSGCILNLEAGQGKSYIAANLISKIQKKTAIILHSSSILGQWKTLLNKLFTNKIGSYYSKEKTDGDIVLLIINSALNEKFTYKDMNNNEKELSSLDYFKQFGFIIYDECHEYCNKWAGRVFKVAQSKYVLGLSATPDENLKGFDKLIQWELGPILVANQIAGFSIQDTRFQANMNRIMYYGPPDYTHIIKNEAIDVVSASSTITMLTYDPYRIKIIIDCIKKCLDKKLYTFVFADRKGYLEVIRKALIDSYKSNMSNNMSNNTMHTNTMPTNTMPTNNMPNTMSTNMPNTMSTNNMSTNNMSTNTMATNTMANNMYNNLNNGIENKINNKINNISPENINEKLDILYDDNDYQRIVGGANENVFKNAEMNSKVIFTTYQYMGTGKSIIKMNGLIMITPRKTKLKQYYNRIFRLGSDANIKREIYMIVDMKTLFARHWTYHKKYCNEMEYNIKEEKIQYTNVQPIKMKPEWSDLLKSNGKINKNGGDDNDNDNDDNNHNDDNDTTTTTNTTTTTTTTTTTKIKNIKEKINVSINFDDEINKSYKKKNNIKKLNQSKLISQSSQSLSKYNDLYELMLNNCKQ